MRTFPNWLSHRLCMFLATIMLLPATAMAVSYTYDPLGRLTSVVYDGGETITYAYDPAGNITRSVRTVNQAAVVTGVCGSANGKSFSAAPSASLCTTGAASAVVGSGPWNWLCQGSNGGASPECSASVSTAPHTLAVSFAGSGLGTVTATAPPGLALSCTGNCATTVTHGTGVTLAATESGGSSFTSWTLCDGVSDKACSLAMNSDRNPIVTFTLQQNLRIGVRDYGTLQTALESVSTGEIIKARNIVVPNSGSASYHRSGIRATFRGGYDAAFSEPPSGYSTFNGALTIISGTLVIDRLVIK